MSGWNDLFSRRPTTGPDLHRGQRGHGPGPGVSRGPGAPKNTVLQHFNFCEELPLQKLAHYI